MVRAAVYGAANVLLARITRFSKLKCWGMDVAKRRGSKRAKVALARKIAGTMHRIYGPAVRCKEIRTEWSFWSALIYPASRGSSCSGPSWLSAHT